MPSSSCYIVLCAMFPCYIVLHVTPDGIYSILRAELAVNLPKLEPFHSAGDEETQGDSDHWTPSPSPSPSSMVTSSAMSTGTRSYRGFSPITESSEHPVDRSYGYVGRAKELSPPLPTSPLVSSQSPTTPNSLYGDTLPGEYVRSPGPLYGDTLPGEYVALCPSMGTPCLVSM